jgi:DNA (cytosine-5)-methyltransferase 1
LHPVISLVGKLRKINPKAIIILWASLECTNFSKAKGGKSRDADSRTLAEHLFRYIEAINPDYIQIENVEEFMSWGDLDENGKPVIKDRGRLYLRWINSVKRYGYRFDHRVLNAADYGAYTSRRRFFGQFARKGLPIAWPEATHSKTGDKTLFGKTERWKPVREVLDFSDEGESIFDRSKQHVEATLDRVLSGLIKFVAGGKDKWLLKYNSVNKETGKHCPPDIDDPCPTIGTQGRLGVVSTKFIQQRNSGNPDSKVFGVEYPARTITSTGGNQELVQTHFLSKYYSGRPYVKNISVDAPVGTIKTVDGHAIVEVSYLVAYYGNGGTVTSVDRPCPTVTTKDRFGLVNPKSLMNNYSGGGQHSDINAPCPAVTSVPKQNVVQCSFIDQQFGQSKAACVYNPLGAVTVNPKYNLVTCKPWLMNTNFANKGSSLDRPAPVVTANRKWHYLVNPQFTSKGRSVDYPCFTLITRMDKRPPYMVEATTDTNRLPSFICITGDTVIYEIYEDDTPKMKEIKEFMAIYGLIDIRMRMLRIPELMRIMGFPDGYILIGTQAERKKYIGNAVEVRQSRSLAYSTASKLIELGIICTPCI